MTPAGLCVLVASVSQAQVYTRLQGGVKAHDGSVCNPYGPVCGPLSNRGPPLTVRIVDGAPTIVALGSTANILGREATRT